MSTIASTASSIRGDLDGFFGLMVDNLLQFLVLLPLCTGLCGLPESFVLERIFPGAALSLLVGNLYYAWLARRLGQQTGKPLTALPFGINTVSLFAFVLFVMGPTYAELFPTLGTERASRVAWQVGLVACVLSGAIELLGGFVADWVRKVTPRAALLSTLAGIAIGLIAMEFVLKSFDKPLIALAPLAIVLVTYLGRVRWPLGLPGGFVAILVGTTVAWGLKLAGLPGGVPLGEGTLLAGAGFHPPVAAFGDLLSAFASPHVWSRLSVIVPMGLINVLGSLQNIESAEADGDRFPAFPCLAMNGVATLVAAGFGSCFPTTIYIGHPGWKRMGAGWAYSAMNGAFFALVAVTGLIGPLARVIPVEAAMAILVWIAVIITTQAFTATPKEHAPAVALGLLPGLAAWGWLLVELTASGFRFSGNSAASLPEIVEGLRKTTLPYVGGLLTLKAGFLFSATLLAAMGVFVVERKFLRAATWASIAAGLTLLGIMHTYTITAGAVREQMVPGAAWPVAIGYAGMALVFLLAALRARSEPKEH